jgi:hypothetical protein
LTSHVEATIPTVVEKIRLVNTNHVDAEVLAYGLDRLAVVLAGGTDQDVLGEVRALVPEYLEFTPRAPFLGRRGVGRQGGNERLRRSPCDSRSGSGRTSRAAAGTEPGGQRRARLVSRRVATACSGGRQ